MSTALSTQDSIGRLTADVASGISHEGSERRNSYRRKVLKGGVLHGAGGTVSFECRVRNLCAGGVMAELDALTELPKRFVFRIAGDNVKRSAEVAWRHGDALGIRFI